MDLDLLPDPNDPLQGRSVLVTGGTGSIGSEIVRQALASAPRVVRIFSRDESKQEHLRSQLPEDSPVRFLIGDVRDRDRLRCALEGIDVVFHAAALKHVPACEYNPFEAVQTNVLGTQNLIQASRDTAVSRLVTISTDKAVNPMNTMGATKLLAENLVRASQEWNPSLRLSTVRFGNVMGSRGSLLPVLVRQMERHREVRITSDAMTRFMMTIGDAVGLVLEASRRSEGGELFILKMPAMRVRDLIDVFVEEYSYRRGWDPDGILRREIGIRSGEKLHEELLTAEECTRMREEDDMYVVSPRAADGQDAWRFSPPESTHSGQASLLDREGIRELIERTGFLEEVGLDTPLTRFLEETTG